MLNKEECDSYYDDLCNILLKLNLKWIVEEITKAIRMGVTEKTRKDTFREISRNTSSPQPINTISKQTQALLFVTRDYTSQEKLKILIQAIQRGVIELSYMSKKTYGYFVSEEGIADVHKDGRKINALRFADENGEKEVFLDYDQIRMGAIRKLDELLKEFMEAI